MGSPSNTSASDAYVSGTVATNAGTVQPGVGQEVNVTIIGPNVVIDAVIVKGGQAYNRLLECCLPTADAGGTAALHLTVQRWRQRPDHLALVRLLSPHDTTGDRNAHRRKGGDRARRDPRVTAPDVVHRGRELRRRDPRARERHRHVQPRRRPRQRRCHNSPAWPTERPAPWSSRTVARSRPAHS